MHRSFRLGKLNSLSLLALALCGVFAGVAFTSNSATASSGGISTGETPAAPTSTELAPRFGNRTLKEGMVGDDVKILKGIVRSQELLSAPLTTDFDAPTEDAVKEFQQDAEITPDGVVNKATSKTLVRSMKKTEASWYGPGLYGNGVACGGTLRPGTVGVAHKTLPCGSKVLVGYRGRYLMTKVIDRGPYIAGRSLDLTYAGAEALDFIDSGVANVRWAVVKRK